MSLRETCTGGFVEQGVDLRFCPGCVGVMVMMAAVTSRPRTRY